MITKSRLAAVALVGLLGACSSNPYPDFEKSEAGLYYQIHHDEPGDVPVEGDYVTIDAAYRTMGDSVFFSTLEAGRPFVMVLPEETYPGDIYSGLKLLSAGDSATFILSADSFFTATDGQNLPEFLKAGDMIKLDVVMREIKSSEEMMSEQMEQMKVQQEEAMKRTEEEKGIIENYLTENNLKGDPQPSGVVIVTKKAGTGPAAEPGKTVRVNYTGRLLDGTVFDTSYEDVAKEANVYNPQRPYEPIEFVLGQGMVIPGWEEGIAKLKTGGKATLVIPSTMAYGAQQAGPIPANSVLVFDVELVEVK